MKTKKKISTLFLCVVAVLCLVFTFSFAACKNSDDDEQSNTSDYTDRYVGAYLDIDDELILSLDESEDGYTVIASLNNTRKQVVIPERFNGLPVTAIDDETFRDCTSLTSVIIPDSVTSIGESAFQGCKALTSVYYYGSSSDWSQITVGDDNEYFTSATVYYYSEEEPTDDGNYWYYVDGEVTIWTKN